MRDQPPESATRKENEENRKQMELIEEILMPANLTEASKEVIRNKGAGGVDGMSIKDLKKYLDENRHDLETSIRNGHFYPRPIRGKEIPKGNGKMRLLGIPTVVDRMLQHAVLRVVMPRYEVFTHIDIFCSCLGFGWCSTSIAFTLGNDQFRSLQKNALI